MIHGRIGFYKQEYLSLGGYDEELVGYGYDDHNLLLRAMAQDYKLMWWGSKYYDRIRTSKKDAVANYGPEGKNWKKTERANKEMTLQKLRDKQYVVNQGIHWGKATVIKNFDQEIVI